MRKKIPSANEPVLTPEEISRELRKRLKPYDKLNLLEQYAMFMGKAQVLEFGLKNLLVRKCGCNLEAMERWTLGRTIKELKQRGIREDFVALLESLLGYRNYIAHELLVNDAMLRKLLGGDSGRLELRNLQRGVYEIEHVILVHDWLAKHDMWGPLA